ncbi:hypothetical protein AB4Y40_11080 [Paraburkholderia sp. EG287B]|uniref:hypothetical protein n=1 Tax=unclassified Paraburkholderia TaxID=2615204 RepID=UPI0034D26A0F
MHNADAVDTTRPRKGCHPFRYKDNALGLERLPFVAGPRSAVAAPYWGVPTTCHGDDAFEVGAAMADAYLKHLREDTDDCPVSDLANIVESFLMRFEQEGGRAMPGLGCSAQSESFGSLRQQCAGFFGTLDAWLTLAAKDSASYLDALTEDMIVQRANRAMHGSLRQIEVVIERRPNGVDLYVSSAVRFAAPFVPVDATPLDLDDARVREFLFAGAERSGFDIPVDSDMDGYVGDDGDETHIRMWLK